MGESTNAEPMDREDQVRQLHCPYVILLNC